MNHNHLIYSHTTFFYGVRNAYYGQPQSKIQDLRVPTGKRKDKREPEHSKDRKTSEFWRQTFRDSPPRRQEGARRSESNRIWNKHRDASHKPSDRHIDAAHHFRDEKREHDLKKRKREEDATLDSSPYRYGQHLYPQKRQKRDEHQDTRSGEFFSDLNIFVRSKDRHRAYAVFNEMKANRVRPR